MRKQIRSASQWTFGLAEGSVSCFGSIEQLIARRCSPREALLRTEFFRLVPGRLDFAEQRRAFTLSVLLVLQQDCGLP